MVETDVVVIVDVVSYQGLDAALLLDLDVQALEVLDVEPRVLLDVVVCLSALLDVDGLMLSIAATAAV